MQSGVCINWLLVESIVENSIEQLEKTEEMV